MAQTDEGIVEKAKDGAGALKDTTTKHPYAIGIAVVALLMLTIRYRGWLTTKLGGFVGVSGKKLLNITSLALFFGATLLIGDAAAATCCAVVQHAASASAGLLAHVWHFVAFAGASGAMLGIVAFPAPDVREAKLLRGSKFATYDLSDTANPEPSIDFYVDGSNPTNAAGEPLVALDEVIEVDAQYETVSTGVNPIYDADLSRTIKSVVMEVPGIGTVLTENVGTGPIIKQIIEFVGLGFNRGGDSPVATITVPTSDPNDVTYKRLFTIPHALRFLSNPVISAMWFGLLDETRVTVKMAAANALAGVSTGSTIHGVNTVRVTTPYVAHKAWHWPVIPYYTLEQPLAGSKDFTLKQFGATGPVGTDPNEFLFLVSLLTNKHGLPGNTTLDNIKQIDCAKLGINKMENVEAFFRERVKAQSYGHTPTSVVGNGNYTDTATPDGGANLPDGKFLNLMQPGLDMSFQAMRKVGQGYQLPMSFEYSSIPTSPAHAVVLGTCRQLGDGMSGTLMAKSNGKLTRDKLRINDARGNRIG